MQNGVLESAPAAGRSSLGIGANGTLRSHACPSPGPGREPASAGRSSQLAGREGEVHALHAGLRDGDAGASRASSRHVIARSRRLGWACRSTAPSRRSRARADADPAAAARCSSRAAPRRPPSSGRRRRRAAGRGATVALTRLERPRERHRRRPAARAERQARLPRERVVRPAPPQQPAAARRDRPARRTGASSSSPSRGRSPPTASACRATSSPSSSPGSARRPRSGSAPAPRPGSRSTASCSRGRPSGVEAKLSDALVLSYTGVYAAPPSTTVLSPNGDGVGDTRDALATASPGPRTSSRRSPARAARRSRSRTRRSRRDCTRSRGTAATAASLAPEGAWTFAVTATDDRNVTTSAQRTFSLDDTLSSLAVKHRRAAACRRRRSS